MKQTMRISIHFFGTQRALTKTDGVDMPITDTARVTDVLEYVRSLYPELPLDLDAVLITVNNEQVSLDAVLKPNDTVSFLPSIGGG
jgi:molybdopterin converting factor small subunit